MEHKVYIKDLIKICNAKLIQGDKNLAFENLCKDTRILKKGEIYLGIKGEKFNGSMLYQEALEKGAIACILQDIDIEEKILKEYPHATIILLENTVKMLQEIAKYKRSLYNIPVVAITGSVGKTSTKDIVAGVLSQKYKVLKTLGNYNNEIGLPLTILNLKDEEIMVVEMGMNSFGEISLLTNIAKPDVAVITNIGTAHIGMLGSRENILKAKLEILEGLEKKGSIVINYDNDMLKKWRDNGNSAYNVITYGINENAKYIAKEIKTSENGSQFKIKIEDKDYIVNVPVGGEHFIYNSLCAISVGSIFNINMNKIIDGIENFELTKNRMEIKKAKCGAIVINDCYNANYDSMKAAIEYLGKLPNKRKIAILGSMLELGEYSKELHEKVGECVVKNNIDFLICVGKEAKNIFEKAINKGFNPQKTLNCEFNKQVIEFLGNYLDKNDAVLIKASNSLNFLEISDAICE